MNSEKINHKGALGLMLYSIIYPANRNIQEWNDDLYDYYLSVYGKEKLKNILESIQYYFSHDDINLAEIMPTNLSVQEKEKYLKFILDGFANSEILKSDNGVAK